MNNYSFWVVFLRAKLRHNCLIAGCHISWQVNHEIYSIRSLMSESLTELPRTTFHKKRRKTGKPVKKKKCLKERSVWHFSIYCWKRMTKGKFHGKELEKKWIRLCSRSECLWFLRFCSLSFVFVIIGVDVLYVVSFVLICDEMEILGSIIEQNLEHTSHSPTTYMHRLCFTFLFENRRSRSTRTRAECFPTATPLR